MDYVWWTHLLSYSPSDSFISFIFYSFLSLVVDGQTKRIREDGDNRNYQKNKQAESNERKLNSRYLHFLRTKAMSENIQLFLGKHIPTYIFHDDNA